MLDPLAVDTVEHFARPADQVAHPPMRLDTQLLSLLFVQGQQTAVGACRHHSPINLHRALSRHGHRSAQPQRVGNHVRKLLLCWLHLGRKPLLCWLRHGENLRLSRRLPAVTCAEDVHGDAPPTACLSQTLPVIQHSRLHQHRVSSASSPQPHLPCHGYHQGCGEQRVPPAHRHDPVLLQLYSAAAALMARTPVLDGHPPCCLEELLRKVVGEP